MKILLVEDEAGTVEMIKLGFQIYEPNSIVVSTDHGMEAIRILKTENYDAAVIDLGLPDIDGAEVITRIRNFSSIPIMVVSARHIPEGFSGILAAGADEYIAKPFHLLHFLERLKKLVNKGESQPVN